MYDLFFFLNFSGILPHESFPKQGLLKEAGMQCWWNSSWLTRFGGKSSLESSASLQDTFEKVSTEKASAEYLKMLYIHSLFRVHIHTHQFYIGKPFILLQIVFLNLHSSGLCVL